MIRRILHEIQMPNQSLECSQRERHFTRCCDMGNVGAFSARDACSSSGTTADSTNANKSCEILHGSRERKMTHRNSVSDTNSEPCPDANSRVE